MAPHALRYRALPRWSLVWRCEVSVSSTRLFALFLFFLPQPLLSQQSSSQELFQKNCAGCHGEDARGTAKAPGLAMNERVAEQSTEQLSTFLERGNIAFGMPSFSDLSASDRAALVRYLRRLNAGIIIRPVAPSPTRKITSGRHSPAIGLLITEMTQPIAIVPSKRSTPRMCPS